VLGEPAAVSFSLTAFQNIFDGTTPFRDSLTSYAPSLTPIFFLSKISSPLPSLPTWHLHASHPPHIPFCGICPLLGSLATFHYDPNIVSNTCFFTSSTGPSKLYITLNHPTTRSQGGADGGVCPRAPLRRDLHGSLRIGGICPMTPTAPQLPTCTRFSASISECVPSSMTCSSDERWYALLSLHTVIIREPRTNRRRVRENGLCGLLVALLGLHLDSASSDGSLPRSGDYLCDKVALWVIPLYQSRDDHFPPPHVKFGSTRFFRCLDALAPSPSAELGSPCRCSLLWFIFAFPLLSECVVF